MREIINWNGRRVSLRLLEFGIERGYYAELEEDGETVAHSRHDSLAEATIAAMELAAPVHAAAMRSAFARELDGLKSKDGLVQLSDVKRIADSYRAEDADARARKKAEEYARTMCARLTRPVM